MRVALTCTASDELASPPRTLAVLIDAHQDDTLKVLDRGVAERIAEPEQALRGREAGRAELRGLGRAEAHVGELLGIGEVEREREDGEVDGEKRRADRGDVAGRGLPERLALGEERAVVKDLARPVEAQELS